MGTKAGQQQETPAQRAMSDHAAAVLSDYKQRWLPVQQKLATTIEAEGEKGSAARNLATGKASTDTAIQFDKAGGALDKALSNSGSAPGSSRGNLAIVGLGSDLAGSAGMGHMMSEEQIDDAYTQGLGALTALGRGQSAQVGQNMTQAAAASGAQASADAQASLMGREAAGGAIGTAAGFGLQQSMRGFGSPAPNTPPLTVDPNGYGIGTMGRAPGGP